MFSQKNNQEEITLNDLLSIENEIAKVQKEAENIEARIPTGLYAHAMACNSISTAEREFNTIVRLINGLANQKINSMAEDKMSRVELVLKDSFAANSTLANTKSKITTSLECIKDDIEMHFNFMDGELGPKFANQNANLTPKYLSILDKLSKLLQQTIEQNYEKIKDDMYQTKIPTP